MSKSRTAGFIWNTPENPAILGAYLPDTINIYASETEILDLFGIDTELNRP